MHYKAWKKSWATTKQTNIQLGFRKFRADQKNLSLLKLFENIYAYISLSSYLCCWLLYIDLRRAFQLQVTHKVSSEKEAWETHPQLGEGEALWFEFVSKLLLCPWGEDISKTSDRYATERGRESFLMVWTCLRGECLLLGDEPWRWESLFVEPVKVSTQKELAIFCWSLWRRIWYTVEFSSKLSSR